jgi:hypothetical protein
MGASDVVSYLIGSIAPVIGGFMVWAKARKFSGAAAAIFSFTALPAIQRDALDAAFRLTDEVAPEPYRIATAALDIVSEVAAESPVLLVVDDAQWLDRPTVRPQTCWRLLLDESSATRFSCSQPLATVTQAGWPTRGCPSTAWRASTTRRQRLCLMERPRAFRSPRAAASCGRRVSAAAAAFPRPGTT